MNERWSAVSSPSGASPSTVVIARAVDLDREQHAALHGLAVQVHRARTAVPGVAADVRPREPEVVAQEVDEEAARRDVELDLLAVHLEGDGAAGRGSSH